MFDFVQNNKMVQLGIKVLLGAIAVSFIGFSAATYNFSGGGANEVARVGDTPITRQDVDRALQMSNLGQDKAEEVTQDLIRRQTLLEEARSLGVRITDEELAEAIAKIPVFQKDGRFDFQAYEDYLRSSSMTSSMFEARFREDMLAERMQQVVGQMFSGGFYSRAANDALAQYLSRERMVSSVRIEPAAFMSKVQITEQQIAAYYKANPAQFRQPEKVRVEYILLSVPVLASAQSASDAEIKEFFDKNKSQFERDERQARHILLTLPEKADAAAKAAVRARAEKLLQEVQANPARFADLARQNSQDPGSAAQGGELGWLSREGLDQKFADALFAMQQPGISGLVESQFGFHIIEMIGQRKTGLEEARATIASRIKEQKARKAFPTLSEELADLAVNNERNLVPVAQKVKLPLQTTDWITREGVAGDPVFSAERKDVLERIFSADGLAGRATEVIELPEQQRLLARVAERVPARMQPLAEVTAVIRARLLEQGAAKLAEAEGKRYLEALSKGENPVLNWSEAQKVSLFQGGQLTPAAVKHVMAAVAKADGDSYSGLAENNGYTLFRLGAFSQAPTDPRLVEHIDRQRLMGEFDSYSRLLQREWIKSVAKAKSASES